MEGPALRLRLLPASWWHRFFAGLAECQRTPFDMAEAESELVSGFNTEYSGLRWGMFAMAEYTEMLLVSALVSTLFLGGYQSPVGEQWIVGGRPRRRSRE